MGDVLLAEVMRGNWTESAHTGAAVVVDTAGAVVFAAGDVDRPEFPRSAVKAILALPLVESGAADRLGLDDAELALACASHTGEPRHVEAARAMLGKAGQPSSCLECGVHWPTSRRAAGALAAEGLKPNALHNNCSGKHAGFVCLAGELGVPVRSYVEPEHPAMRLVTQSLADLAGAALDDRNRAVDGCAIPTYAIALRDLALAFARFGTGHGMPPARAEAAKRLRQAVWADPFMVGGEGRFDSVLMGALGCTVFSKIGAEGVVAAALPERGLGIAVKARDGAPRAAEVAAAALIARFAAPSDASAQRVLESLMRPEIRNWNATLVGSLRPGPSL